MQSVAVVIMSCIIVNCTQLLALLQCVALEDIAQL